MGLPPVFVRGDVHTSPCTVHSYRDSDGRLIVWVRGKRLLLFARYARVTFYQLGHDTAGGLDTQRQRRDVHQQHVLDGRAGVAGQDGSLHSGAVRHSFVRVDGQVQRFAAEKVLYATDGLSIQKKKTLLKMHS